MFQDRFTRQDEPDPRVRSTLNLLQRLLNPQDHVVEIGVSSVKQHDLSFKHRLQHSHWESVDKFGNPDHVADLDGPDARLPFDDRTIDLVVCTEVLEHLREGSFLVREISRVLKPTGHAVVSVPNITSLKSRVRWASGRIPHMAASGDCGHPLGGTGSLQNGSWVAAHVVDFSPSRLKAYLERGGLRVETHCSMPLRLSRHFPSIEVPGTIMPRALADFVLVVAAPA